MDKTAIQASVPPTPPAAPDAGDAAPPPARNVRRPNPLMQVLAAVASLRVTVVLFALSLVLVFAGTLAQVDQGIWTVVEKYFRSFFVWVPLQIFFPRALNVPGGFPFLGGWGLGTLLLINLLAAHAVRFKLSWKRSGIILLHAGIIVMMLGELVAGLYQVEGHMTIDEGGSSNFIVQNRFAELAITSPSDDPKYEDVTVVPASLLRTPRAIHDDRLPFDIEVVQFMVNSDLRNLKPGEENPATAGTGLEVVAVEQAEVSGTATKQTADIPSAYVRLKGKDGADLGTYLVSAILSDPQPVTVGDRTYSVALRFKRTYKPYSVHLINFSFDRYEGTSMARNFSSLVRVSDDDGDRSPGREILIKMNDPLRHRGDTLYQSSFDERTEKTTVLQVVSNPGALMPYIACVMVSAGMLLHFGLSLVTFLNRRAVK